MSRLLIASFCLFAVAQAAYAEGKPKSFSDEGFKLSRSQDYGSRDPLSERGSTDHDADYGLRDSEPGGYKPRYYKAEHLEPKHAKSKGSKSKHSKSKHSKLKHSKLKHSRPKHSNSKYARSKDYEGRRAARPNAPAIVDEEYFGATERASVPGDGSFDRSWRNRDDDDDDEALSPVARHDLDMFAGEGRCSACHELNENDRDVSLLPDFEFHGPGADFRLRRSGVPEREKVAHEQSDEDPFRTPSIYNAVLTAPYMHGGSPRTLDEAIEFYDEGSRENANRDHEIRPSYLSRREREALTTFIRSFSGPEYERDMEEEEFLK
jgi:hypothetical protein